jgi:hypothetical protein
MAHLVPAVQAFHRSLSLSRTASHQQDAMRFLTLWFKYGSVPELASAMESALGSLPIDTWLDVVPQIIARINLPDTVVRGQIHDLLFRIGREHPQVLIYPLTVAGESPDPVRKEAGRSLLHRMSTGCEPVDPPCPPSIRKDVRAILPQYMSWQSTQQVAESDYRPCRLRSLSRACAARRDCKPGAGSSVCSPSRDVGRGSG